MKDKKERFQLRRQRVKDKLYLSQKNKPRLCVFRSSRYIYAQILDDRKGITIASASSLEKELKGKMKSGKNIETARKVGELIGKRAIEKGVKEVCFDRNGLMYHGRIKALAEASRKCGLKF